MPSAMVPGEKGAIGVPVPGGRTMASWASAVSLHRWHRIGAAWPMAPQKSATVETQPKNFSML